MYLTVDLSGNQKNGATGTTECSDADAAAAAATDDNDVHNNNHDNSIKITGRIFFFFLKNTLKAEAFTLGVHKVIAVCST